MKEFVIENSYIELRKFVFVELSGYFGYDYIYVIFSGINLIEILMFVNVKFKR